MNRDASWKKTMKPRNENREWTDLELAKKNFC